MEEYKGWPCYEEIPDGWRIDKTAGSPLHGYEFIINGSPLKGGKRALARVYKINGLDSNSNGVANNEFDLTS